MFGGSSSYISIANQYGRVEGESSCSHPLYSELFPVIGFRRDQESCPLLNKDGTDCGQSPHDMKMVSCKDMKITHADIIQKYTGKLHALAYNLYIAIRT